MSAWLSYPFAGDNSLCAAWNIFPDDLEEYEKKSLLKETEESHTFSMLLPKEQFILEE